MDTGHKWHSTGKCIRTLLFLIYINDLPENVNSTVYMYADDTKIYREIKSEYDEEKFTYSMIEDGKKFDMTKVSEMKDIGVTVDWELKFDKHINTKIETCCVWTIILLYTCITFTVYR